MAQGPDDVDRRTDPAPPGPAPDAPSLDVAQEEEPVPGATEPTRLSTRILAKLGIHNPQPAASLPFEVVAARAAAAATAVEPPTGTATM